MLTTLAFFSIHFKIPKPSLWLSNVHTTSSKFTNHNNYNSLHRHYFSFSSKCLWSTVFSQDFCITDTTKNPCQMALPYNSRENVRVPWNNVLKKKNRLFYLGGESTGATLEISIHGFTSSQGPHFILKINSSLAHELEIQEFTRRGSGNPRVHRNPRNLS